MIHLEPIIPKEDNETKKKVAREIVSSRDPKRHSSLEMNPRNRTLFDAVSGLTFTDVELEEARNEILKMQMAMGEFRVSAQQMTDQMADLSKDLSYKITRQFGFGA